MRQSFLEKIDSSNCLPWLRFNIVSYINSLISIVYMVYEEMGAVERANCLESRAYTSTPLICVSLYVRQWDVIW